MIPCEALMRVRQLIIEKHPEVYAPSEDTLLLANNLDLKQNDTILEIGIGSGFVSLVAAQKAKYVVGTDINPYAVKLAKLNARLNNISNVEFILGDLFSPIHYRFDLILINPPYLQDAKLIHHRPIDDSWDGGRDGRTVTDRFLDDVEKYLRTEGRILIVQSSLSDHNKTIRELSKKGFKAQIAAYKKVFFETIYLIQATEVVGE